MKWSTTSRRRAAALSASIRAQAEGLAQSFLATYVPGAPQSTSLEEAIRADWTRRAAPSLRLTGRLDAEAPAASQGDVAAYYPAYRSHVLAHLRAAMPKT